jgi:hypothetical protein
VVEIVPRHPGGTSGKNESVKFLADEKKRSVRADTSGMKLATMNGAADPAGGCEVQVRCSFGGR